MFLVNKLGNYRKAVVIQANTVDLFDVFELIFKDIGGEEHFNAMSAIVR